MLYTNRYIIVDKIINRILAQKNHLWSFISPSTVCRQLLKNNKFSENALYERLNNILGSYTLFTSEKCNNNDIEQIINRANQSLHHVFDILGSGSYKLDPINWHTDFIHGYSWEEKKFYKRYNQISKNGGYDIKVVWDFNRCHHLLWMAEAFLITGNLKFAEEVITEIQDWIDKNPLMYSVNWTCSMDVSIRAVNWMYALTMIQSSKLLDDEIASKIYQSLYEHLFFIANNLEKTIPVSGNHYLSDLVGIIHLSSIFYDNIFAKQCMLLAVKEFYRETLKELNEDGSSYENSVSYHRLVTELFLYTYLILVRQGYTVPENVIKRIKRSTDYIGNYTKKSGLAPLIGDNDNGQLLPLVPHDYLNHSYLFKLGKLIFGNYKSDTITEAQFLNIISTNLNDTFERHVVFDTGLAIVDKGSARLYVNNGYFSFDKGKKIGELSGTHTHCDNLSFELCLGSDDIFVDPGCYVYTSDPYMRNLFRSAESHNTVTVDEKNLGDYSDASVFLLKQVLYNLSLSHNYTNTEEIVEGCFNFNNGQLSYTHNRIFELSDSTLKITDSIKAKGSHSANLYLIIHPNIRIEASPVGLILSSDTYRITLQVADSDGYLKKPTIERWYYSPSYGNLKKNNRLKYDLPFSETVKINTIIKWEKLK